MEPAGPSRRGRGCTLRACPVPDRAAGRVGERRVALGDDRRPGERLGWTGGPYPLLRGHHWFDLAGQDCGTLLRHGENLTGVYPWLNRRTIGARFRPGYVAMNEALARRLE